MNIVRKRLEIVPSNAEIMSEKESEKLTAIKAI